jgi:hypothetical protein
MVSKNFLLVLSFIAAGTLSYGCGNKQIKPEVQKPAEPVAEQPKPAMDHYTVVKSDTLWGIAGKPSIYSDSFQWPVIFKANRDEIKDPDLIYPQQDFKIQKGLSSEEVSHARDLASKTPKYVPHASPRETLPVDYF